MTGRWEKMDGSKNGRKRNWYKASLMLSGVATAIGTGTMGVMLSYIISSYGLAASQEGYMSSCISAGALAALFFGILLRGKVPKVGFIISGGILMSVMLFVKGFPVTFSVFLIVCFAMGIGSGIMDSFQSAFLSDLEPEQTAENLGMFHGIFGIGGVVLPIVLHRMLGIYDWRMVYRIVSISALVLIVQFIIMTAVRKEDPVLYRVEKAPGFTQLQKFIRDPYFILLLICMLLAAAAQNGILVWTVRYVSNTLGDLELAPVCLSVFWVASTVSRIFSPRLPWRPIRTLFVGSVIAGAAWCTAIMIGTPVGVLAGCAAAGLAGGCGIPLLLNEGAVFNRNNTGLTTSTLMIVKTIGQMLNPLLIAALQVRIGVKYAMFTIGIVFVVDGIIAAIMTKLKAQECVIS